MDVKRLKLQEDRISDLPDDIIQHILSFLPSTKEAIQTGILSKRWQNQWTQVPVLTFAPDYDETDYDKNIIRLIENALLLYDCSKIKRLELGYNFREDPDFALKLRFTTRKHVEELILICNDNDFYMLPKFLINNSLLVKLKMFNCSFLADWSINWPSLKILDMNGSNSPPRPSIRKILSGCPMLESLKLQNSVGDDGVIASKTLKRLILYRVEIHCHMTISCPNLVELVIDIIREQTSGSGLRHEMVEISCPNLKSVSLFGWNFKLVNCPSLVYATLNFEIDTEIEGNGENVAKKNLEQLQNVKMLTVWSRFIKALSVLEMKGLSYPMLNNKFLNLHLNNFEHLPDIVCTLRSSPVLEHLNVCLPLYTDQRTSALPNLNNTGENCWNSIGTDINCLVSHLKFVEIYCCLGQDPKASLVINFIEFLLKNARLLEDINLRKKNGFCI